MGEDEPMTLQEEMRIRNRTEYEILSRDNVNPIKLENGLNEITVLNHFQMYVYSHDFSVGSNLLKDGYWEYWVSLFLIRIIQPGWDIADIGANYGYYSLLFSYATGESGTVYAFEPNYDLSYLIEESAKLNERDNIEVISSAVSDHDGIVKIFIPDNYFGDASISYQPAGANILVRDVATVTLDSFFHKRMNLIKIDAEGSEVDILLGSQNYITKYAPIIVMEWYAPRMMKAKELYEFMTGLGYRFYVISFNSILEGVNFDYLSNTTSLDMLLLAR